VPVAQLHVVDVISDDKRQEYAMQKFQQASHLANKALVLLQDFEEENLKAVLFSAEG
jgi:hypothetical protein